MQPLAESCLFFVFLGSVVCYGDAFSALMDVLPGNLFWPWEPMTWATPNPLQTARIPTQHLKKNDAEGTITNVAATIDLHRRYPQRFSVAQQTQADGIDGKLLVAWQLLALGYLKTIIAANNLDTAACAMHCNHDIFNPVLVHCAKTRVVDFRWCVTRHFMQSI